MFEKIQESELKTLGISNVSTTPTKRTPYGESGFTAAELKERFDKLPRYLAARLNEIFEGMETGELAGGIKLSADGGSVKHILNGLFDGSVADKLLIKTPTEEVTLAVAVVKLLKLLDEIDNGELPIAFGALPLMTSLDEAAGNLEVADKNGNKFPDLYNRVYVERSGGRGLYTRYCLTGTPVAPFDPDPEDYVNGKTMDSIPMRMADGFMRVPRSTYGETQPSTGNDKYDEKQRVMSKEYIDTGIAAAKKYADDFAREIVAGLNEIIAEQNAILGGS